MLPLNPRGFDQALHEAIALARAGRGDDALAAFKRLEAAFGDRAEVPFQIGGLLRSTGRMKEASAAFERAAKLAPGQGAIWQAWAETLSDWNDKPAIARAKKAMKAAKLPPAQAKALAARMTRPRTETNRISRDVPAQVIRNFVAALQAGKAKEVEAEVAGLCARAPRNEVLRQLHGLSLNDLGRVGEAEAAFREAVRLDPGYAEARAYLAQTLLDQDRIGEARAQITRAQTLLPRSPLVLGIHARCQLEEGHFQAALELFDRFLETAPDNRLGRLGRAQALGGLNRLPEALADLDHLDKHARDDVDLLCIRAKLLGQAGRSREALVAADKAVALRPDYPFAVEMQLAHHMNLGEFERGREILAGALERGVVSGELFRLGARGGNVAPDSKLAAAMLKAWEAGDGRPHDRAALGFALAKVYEDAGQHALAWPYLEAANRTLHALHPYDATGDWNDLETIRKLFAHANGAALEGRGFEGDRTIFVSGMPRSGTTLVEQILASHPDVTGGGELALFNQLAFDAVVRGPRRFESLAALPRDLLKKLGERYHNALPERVPGLEPGGRATDKSLATFQTMGLIWAALPNARIVSVGRDPRAMLFSIFKNQFAIGTHPYAYDQETLVARYESYLAFMDFWRSVAPERMFELQYEALVEDPEPEIHRLLDFCGLDWDPACMEFHKTRREVNTLSGHQVRQPLYKSSLAAWQPYEAQLETLLDGLAKLRS